MKKFTEWLKIREAKKMHKDDHEDFEDEELEDREEELGKDLDGDEEEGEDEEHKEKVLGCKKCKMAKKKCKC